jgi:amino acid transporter
MDQNQNEKKNDKSEKKITKDILDVFRNRDLVIFSNYLYYLSYFLYFIAIILLTVTYWKTHLGENAKFQTYVQLLMAATIIMTVYSVYLQQVTYRETSTYNQLNNFDNNFKELLDDTLKFFIDNPEMNYYYEELFYNKSNYKEEDRNKNLETQFSFIILSRVSNIIYSVYVYGNKFSEKNEKQYDAINKTFNRQFFSEKCKNEGESAYQHKKY